MPVNNKSPIVRLKETLDALREEVIELKKIKIKGGQIFIHRNRMRGQTSSLNNKQ